MKERTCVSRFVDKSRIAFENNASLKDVLSTIPHYRRLIWRAYGPMRNPIHNLATSTVGLKTLATYELLRHKGFPLISSNAIAQTMHPVQKWLGAILLGESKDYDSRPEKIDSMDEIKI